MTLVSDIQSTVNLRLRIEQRNKQPSEKADSLTKSVRVEHEVPDVTAPQNLASCLQADALSRSTPAPLFQRLQNTPLECPAVRLACQWTAPKYLERMHLIHGPPVTPSIGVDSCIVNAAPDSDLERNLPVSSLYQLEIGSIPVRASYLGSKALSYWKLQLSPLE